MISSSVVLLTALVYLCALFAVAHFGDTRGRQFVRQSARSPIYALSIAVYCTSWTFFGSVGIATSRGLDFLPIYIGPFIVFVFGQGLLRRMIRIAKAQNITSLADFVSARYGKSEAVAAVVALVAVLSVVPYIALQLKAVSASLSTVLQSLEAGQPAKIHSIASAPPFVVAILLAGFAMAFGTRRVDMTEHQDGLILAIAVESIVKLCAFLIVGLYVTFGMADLFQSAHPPTVTLSNLVARTSEPGTFLTMTLLSASAILLLPRQFHVTVVENRDIRDVRTAGRLFPVYMVAINLFVLPIALAGLAMFPEGHIDRDMTVLTLPIARQNGFVMLAGLVGGLSAATAMVIVGSVASSIMISNDLVMPILLRRRASVLGTDARDLSKRILVIRRLAIVLMMLLGYGYFRLVRSSALSSIGLLSFAAIAQITPAFIAGFIWRRGTARGVMVGLCVGTGLYLYTLFLPSFDDPPEWLANLIAHGPMGVAWLRPTAILGVKLPSLTHGALWSLFGNTATFVIVSLTRQPTTLEKLQASVFAGAPATPVGSGFRLWRARVTEQDIEVVVARYLGKEQARLAFAAFAKAHGRDSVAGREADPLLLEFAERHLAAAIGAASSRLVMSLLLRRGRTSARGAVRLLDDAATAIRHNRDLLQHAIDHVRQGIAVIDRDVRLICWNREFRDLFDLPPEILRVGVAVEEIVAFNAQRGLYGPGRTEDIVAERLESLTTVVEPFRLRLVPNDKVIEVRSSHMPDGGTVTTYTDVTESVAAEQSLSATNELLEQRVRQRTEELVRLNTELATAKTLADEANASKTRFLAAASHDILQPLNAARLYTSALVEKSPLRVLPESPPSAGPPLARHETASDQSRLARNIDSSLEAVEEILTALLDISRLDAGAMRTERTSFRIEDILRQLELEFGPLAAEKRLQLRFVRSSASVRSDRRLLRRVLQNLVSNAIKYTPRGRVLVGCRRLGRSIVVQVWDTGLGIAPNDQKTVFREFERLDEGAKAARGIGLGLSIVERIARVLDHRITLESHVGVGSMFAVELPVVPALPQPAAGRPAAVPITAQPFLGLFVLAIDNEPRILDGMAALLDGWGCTVVTAPDLERAEQALREARRGPDVVIADFHLDTGDGIEAIIALRWKFGPDVRAVLLTADRSTEVRDRAGEKAIHIFTKPLKPAALRALLSQWRIQRGAAE